MVRKKLAAAIAAMGALQAGVVCALGMGDFSLDSALNQPLAAEISLRNVDDLDASQVLVKMASASDFANAGVSRDFFLTNIRFSVVLDGQGGGVIKVTTREPVVEPYLNFLVEAHWPSGRLLREYTVLLDLPVFSDSDNQKTVSAATTTSNSKPAVTASSAPRATAVPRSTASSSQVVSPSQKSTDKAPSPGDKYRVQNDDTLWDIALKSRPTSDVSVQQTMLGIHQLNPQAFIRGNINRLKAGSVLRLPTENEISLSERDAVGAVANHNRAWRQGDEISAAVNDIQLDATANNQAPTNQYTESARLSIAASGEDERSAAGDGSGGSGGESLQNELAITQEILDKSNRDNQDLQTRLEDMDYKLATLQRLIELKDDQLAAMQGGIASAVESPTIEADADSAIESSTDTGTSSTAITSETEDQLASAKPEPAKVKTRKDDVGLIDGMLANPLYSGGAGLLILAAAVVLLMRRRKAKEPELELDADTVEAAPEELIGLPLDNEETSQPEAFSTEVEVAEEVDSTEQLAVEIEEQIAADNAARAEAENLQTDAITAVEPETGDVIAEADIYVAYGRYQQALDLLASAIEKEPTRSALHVKLLEILIDNRNKSSFQQNYRVLQSLGDESAVAEVKEMLSTVDGVADWLDDLPMAEGASASSLVESDFTPSLEDDQELSIEDEFEIDLNPGEETTETLDLDLDDFSLDETLENDSISLDDVQLEVDETELTEGLDAKTELNLDTDTVQQIETTEPSLDLDLSDTELDELFQSTDLDSELLEDLTALADASEDTFELSLDDDLDLDALADSDLKDLEAEFADFDDLSSLESTDLDLSEDLTDELEDDFSAGVVTEDVSDDTLELEMLDFDQAPEKTPAADSVEYSLDDVAAELAITGALAGASEHTDASTDAEDDSSEDDFDFLADSDEIATKLDLARAYIDMGDADGARDILDEVILEGSEEQKQEADSLLERIE